MAFAIVWAEVAVEDLDEVAGFIARDSRYYASALVREARLAAQSLRRFPYRGRVSCPKAATHRSESCSFATIA